MLKQIIEADFFRLSLTRDPRPVFRLFQWVLPLMVFGITVGYEVWEHAIERSPLNNLHLGVRYLSLASLAH